MAFTNKALARKVLDKFGYGPLSVNEFDKFLDREKLLTRSTSDDKQSQEHRGMVVARARIKRSICSASCDLGEESYTIKVRSNGKEWEIVPWGTGADETIKTIGERIKITVENHAADFNRTEAKALKMLDDDPCDENALIALAAIQHARQQKLLLQATIENVCDMYTASQKNASEAGLKLENSHTESRPEQPKQISH